MSGCTLCPRIQQTEEELLPMVAEEDIILQSYNLTNDN